MSKVATIRSFRHGFLGAAVGTVLGVAACSARAPGQPPQIPGVIPKAIDAGEVRFLNVDPVPGTVLRRGQRLHVRVSVEYVLSGGDEGMLTLVLQDEKHRLLMPGGQPTERITRGTGEKTLEADLTLPSKGISMLQVWIPLSVKGYQGTSTVVRQDFAVK